MKRFPTHKKLHASPMGRLTNPLADVSIDMELHRMALRIGTVIDYQGLVIVGPYGERRFVDYQHFLSLT